jgi:DNA polymerase III subunit delta'
VTVRPMGFDSFLGNRKALAEVRDMLAAGRVSGALLFAGPDGVGKKSLALMLAKAMNCERQDGDFCGKCAHCLRAEEMLSATREDIERRRLIKDAQRRVEGLVYFDIQLIEPLTRHILIEQVRQMRNLAYTHPFQLPRRVFVIDQAQTIHWQAVDLLLKMLEEPPETTTFILVCPNAYELRSTIRSRCRRVQFLPVEDSILAEILERESQLTPAQRALGVRIAGGSLAAAKTLDLAAFQRRRRPWLDFFDALAGSTATGDVPAGRKSGSRACNWPLIFDSTKALTESREDFVEVLRIGYALLRDLLQMLNSPAETVITNLDVQSQLKAWASALGLPGIERIKSGLDQAYRLQTRNVNQQLGLEALAIDVVSHDARG